MTCAEVNFKVSQKESFKPDGEIVATKWILYPLMHRSHEQSTVDPKTADEWKQLSTIEVRVLRCEGDTKHDPSSIFGSIPPPDMPRVATKYGQWKYHPFGGLNRNANQSGKSPAGNFTPTVTKTGSNTLSTFDMQRLHNFIPQHSNTVPFNQHAGSSDQLHSSKSELAFNWSSESYRNLQTQLENAYNVIDAENPEKQHSHINIKYRGREYRHTVATPKYIDTLDKPYARFLFQYRDKGTRSKVFSEKKWLRYD